MRHRIFTTASFKLTLLYAVIFSLSVLGLVLLMFFSIRASLEQQIRDHIDAETTQLLGDYEDDGLDELRHDIRERIEKLAASRLYYTVQRPDGRAIFDKLPHVTEDGWQMANAQEGSALLIKATTLDNDYTLLVAADMSRVQALETLIRNRFLLVLALTVSVGLLGGLWASKRFLIRVDSLAKTAERIGEGFLSERIALSGSNDEFDQLAMVINRMLERIEMLVANLQHGSTNIAHDLRTPLSRLRQKLEMLGDSEQVQEAIVLMDEALATFSGLLRIAEIESGSRRVGFAPLDLSALFARLAEIYAPMAEEQHQQFDADIAPDVSMVGDEALLMQLFANLIENALIHGGEGCHITLHLAADGSAVIADTGPGIPEAERSEVLKPFYRLDRSRHSKGNGLGLNIANAIANLHDFTMTLGDNQPGLRIEIAKMLIGVRG